MHTRLTYYDEGRCVLTRNKEVSIVEVFLVRTYDYSHLKITKMFGVY